MNKNPVAFATGAALLFLTVTEARALTFADFHSTGSNTNATYTQSASLTGGTLNASDQVLFDFLLPGLSSTEFNATYTMTGTIPTGTPAQNLGNSGFLEQDGVSGSFSFIYSGPTETVDGLKYIQNVSNLLSGSLSNGIISGQSGSSSASFVDSANQGGSLTFTSDYLKLSSNPLANGLSISMTSVLPLIFAVPGESLESFKSVTGGSFDSATVILAVPEPATWSLMILGFGLAGLALRRRRRLIASPA